MSKHHGLDDLDPTSTPDLSWLRGLAASDPTLDTPRHLFFGRHAVPGELADEGLAAGKAETPQALFEVESETDSLPAPVSVDPVDSELQAMLVETEPWADDETWLAAMTGPVSATATVISEPGDDSDVIQPVAGQLSLDDALMESLLGAPLDEAPPVEASVSEAEPDETAWPEAPQHQIPPSQAEAVPPTAPAGTRSRLGRLRKPVLIGTAAAICLLTAGGGTVAAMTKDVAIVVDGHTEHVSTLAGTVSGALAAAGIAPTDHDTLAPAGSTAISDGSTIVLDRGRKLTLTIDGKPREVWTTARTVDQALNELGVAGSGGTELALSANRSRAIPLTGLSLSGTLLRSVSVQVGADAPVKAESSATTVGSLLAQQKIALGPHDTVAPAVSAPLAPGLTVVIRRVATHVVTKTVTVAQPADKRVADATLAKGTTAVRQKGTAGSERVSYQVTTVNGKQTGQRETARTTVVAAAPTVIRVGTKVPAPASVPAAQAAASKFTYVGDEVFTNDTTFGVNWDGLAMCESTHNPKAVNANPSAGLPTYGMFQFDIPTWESVGGSGNPMDASPEEQLMRAKLLYQQRGLEPWACAYAAQ